MSDSPLLITSRLGQELEFCKWFTATLGLFPNAKNCLVILDACESGCAAPAIRQRRKLKGVMDGLKAAVISASTWSCNTLAHGLDTLTKRLCKAL